MTLENSLDTLEKQTKIHKALMFCFLKIENDEPFWNYKLYGAISNSIFENRFSEISFGSIRELL